MTEIKYLEIQKIEEITFIVKEQKIQNNIVPRTDSRTTLLPSISMEKLIAKMTNTEDGNKNFHFPIKKCWKVGDKILVSIDESIIKKLEINGSNTFLEQKITGHADILMTIKRI